MTAEIAVLNQEAVAMAADSAVSGPKIFTSANKIFALSKYQPVAVMIYDSGRFLDVPWETIIKTYRAELGERSFATLRDQAAHFLGFFDRQNPLFPPEAQERANGLLFFRYFRAILDDIDARLQERLGEGEELSEEDIAREGADVVKALRDDWLVRGAVPSLPASHGVAAMSAYAEAIDQALDSVFHSFPMSDEATGHLREIAGALVDRDYNNPVGPSNSGVVIAGFGADEYFPRLYEFKLETVALDRLKYFQHAQVEISGDNPAVIRPFAQSEQVATFMSGIDDTMRNRTFEYWQRTLPDLMASAADSAGLDQTARAKFLTDIADEAKKALATFAEGLSDMQQEFYISPVIRVVAMMPKDELAAMAESLVNLTSFKRKVSEEAETVAGPIDVAVISKGDGLVWIKRKHYFSGEQNLQFFANYYREGR